MQTRPCDSALRVPSFALAFVILSCGATFAQVTSTWSTTPNSNDWFDPLNWSNGIPNGPADTALLAGSTTANVLVELTAPATVGQLDILGSGALTIGGEGPLVFHRTGDTPATVETFLPRSRILGLDIAAPIEVADNEGLVLNIVRNTEITLSGEIISSTGDITKTGEGDLVLASDNSVWNGVFTVTEGDVVLQHAAALGGAGGVTRIAGGRILVGNNSSPPRSATPTTLEGPLRESFQLEAGALETTQHFLGLEGALTLSPGNTAILRGPFVLRGGSQGDGDLRIVATEFASTSVRDAPLAHAGGVEITSGESSRQFARFDVDNSYGGPTTINNIRLDVRTAGGLGDPAVGTTIRNGSNLRLHGDSAEEVIAFDSTISLWSPEATLPELRPSGRYTLHDSVLTTYGAFGGSGSEVYVLTQPVTLSGTANEIATDSGGIRIAGGLQGSGDLVLNPDGDFPIEIASKIDLDGRLEVRGGAVHFAEPGVFEGRISAHNGGHIVVPVDQKFDRIRFGRLARVGNPAGSIDVQRGAKLELNRLNMVQGTIRGDVNVAEGITLSGFVVGRTLSHVTSGIEVNLQGGVVELDDTTPGRAPSNVTIHLERSRETAISVARGSLSDATFYLNNSSGVNFGGALVLNGDTSSVSGITLRGDIHLGDTGAHIGGTEGQTRIEGQVYGGDLNLGRMRGSPGLNFVNGPAAYTGATRIFSGQINLSEKGALTNTESIEVAANGAMYFDFATADTVTDRVKDSIPVVLNGGEIAAWPTEAGVDASERVETIYVKRGLSSAHGTVFTNGLDELSSARLTVGEIVRSPGAVLMTQTIQQRNRVVGSRTLTPLDVENAPPVTNGILPPWLIAGQTQFATIGPDGVEAYSGPTVSLANSNPTSIVRPTSRQMLEDRSIHAWSGFGNTPDVDMNGHRLTIGSGGLIGPKLSNGVVVAGDNASGELIIATDFIIDANIQDNGSPTSVVYIGDGEIGGVNTYTGKTYVTGLPGADLIVKSASALPTGGDVEVNGNAHVLLRASGSNMTYDLGEVAIRDSARLIMQFSGGELRARSINFESGELRGPLAGDFTITKTTEGLAAIYGQSPGYEGTVDVMAGTLNALEGYRAFGQGTVNVYPEGRLVLPLSGGANTPSLNLHGGSILGDGNGDGTSWNGDIHVLEDSTFFTLNGLDDNTIAADITVDGSIYVADGKSLSVVGRPDSARGLRALSGIHLGEGSVLAGTGSVRSHVSISHKGILSPGLAGESNTVGALATSLPNSNDELHESLMTWGEGGRYRWEINDVNGTAGASFGDGWDLLRVGVLLEIEATRDNPFIIEPIALTPDGATGAIDGLKFNHTYSWLIAENGTVNNFTAAIEGFAADKFAVDVSTFREAYPQASRGDFWLSSDEQGIYLNLHIVPEPTGVSTFCLLMILGLVPRKHRYSVRH